MGPILPKLRVRFRAQNRGKVGRRAYAAIRTRFLADRAFTNGQFGRRSNPPGYTPTPACHSRALPLTAVNHCFYSFISRLEPIISAVPFAFS